jgi:CRISPR-associated protein Cmr6
MAIAAVPDYLGNDYSQASPGLRFGMYLRLWGINSRSGERLWTTHDVNYRVSGRDRQEREFRDETKTSALKEALRLSSADQTAMAALAARQAGIAKKLVESGTLLRLEAQSIAPFATGLGNEHPLENGFAFLNPYGLPYLAGSGVKGVLRQAARELASGEWGDSKGWNDDTRFPLAVGRKTIELSLLDVLFGRQGEDGDTEHVRGVLSFWDVYPQIKGDALVVEVMTPHQTHYYQGPSGATPHESGSPNPINFLSVPAGSGFAFSVSCDLPFLKRVAPDLASDARWMSLLKTAFEHAFTWLGFGAKTAVGYGAMRGPGGEQEGTGQRAGAVAGEGAEKSAIQTEQWRGVELGFNAGNKELTVSYQGKRAAARDAESQRLRDLLPEDLKARLIKQKVLKNCVVEVEPIGNAWRLVEIRSVGGVSLFDH